MNDYLYQEFLECLMYDVNLSELLMHHGINGILKEFEEWLIEGGYITNEDSPQKSPVRKDIPKEQLVYGEWDPRGHH